MHIFKLIKYYLHVAYLRDGECWTDLLAQVPKVAHHFGLTKQKCGQTWHYITLFFMIFVKIVDLPVN